MALQGDYTSADTVEHTACYAKIEIMQIDRVESKARYNVVLYHNAAARNTNAPMFTLHVEGALEDYEAISEIDVVKRAYLHLKSIEDAGFGTWTNV